jgi:hypothetical protein
MTTVYATGASANIEEGVVYAVTVNPVVYPATTGTTYNAGTTFTGLSGYSTFSGTGTATAVIAHCNLPEHTHDEIVRFSANMVLENIEQERYKSHTVELSKVE